MATPLGNTFPTDEQVVAQGDVTYMGKTIESLIVEFDQAKYEEFLSSGSKSPKARVYRKVSSRTCSQVCSEILSDATGKKDAVANCIMRNTRVNVSQETRVVNVPDVQPVISFLSARLPGVPFNPHDVTGIPNGDRGGVRGNYKLGELFVQQR